MHKILINQAHTTVWCKQKKFVPNSHKCIITSSFNQLSMQIIRIRSQYVILALIKVKHYTIFNFSGWKNISLYQNVNFSHLQPYGANNFNIKKNYLRRLV